MPLWPEHDAVGTPLVPGYLLSYERKVSGSGEVHAGPAPHGKEVPMPNAGTLTHLEGQRSRGMVPLLPTMAMRGLGKCLERWEAKQLLPLPAGQRKGIIAVLDLTSAGIS